MNISGSRANKIFLEACLQGIEVEVARLRTQIEQLEPHQEVSSQAIKAKVLKIVTDTFADAFPND